MGLEAFEHNAERHDLCACGHPREVAWHSEMDGWYEGRGFVCHACTARNGGKQVAHWIAVDTRPPGHPELPPFVLGVTTSEP
jgi:hypothetical protein